MMYIHTQKTKKVWKLHQIAGKTGPQGHIAALGAFGQEDSLNGLGLSNAGTRHEKTAERSTRPSSFETRWPNIIGPRSGVIT